MDEREVRVLGERGARRARRGGGCRTRRSRSRRRAGARASSPMKPAPPVTTIRLPVRAHAASLRTLGASCAPSLDSLRGRSDQTTTSAMTSATLASAFPSPRGQPRYQSSASNTVIASGANQSADGAGGRARSAQQQDEVVEPEDRRHDERGGEREGQRAPVPVDAGRARGHELRRKARTSSADPTERRRSPARAPPGTSSARSDARTRSSELPASTSREPPQEHAGSRRGRRTPIARPGRECEADRPERRRRPQRELSS